MNSRAISNPLGRVTAARALSLLLYLGGSVIPAAAQPPGADQFIRLPAPSLDGSTSVEQALAERRSVREFSDEAPSLEEIGQLLWAAQGVTEPAEQPRPGWRAEWQWMGGLRTAPSNMR
jgi:hypothetical protein